MFTWMYRYTLCVTNLSKLGKRHFCGHDEVVGRDGLGAGIYRMPVEDI